jgi:hypothetical protein
MRLPLGHLFNHDAVYENGEVWWNDIAKRKLKNSEKTLFQCHFVHQKSPMD